MTRDQKNVQIADEHLATVKFAPLKGLNPDAKVEPTSEKDRRKLLGETFVKVRADERERIIGALRQGVSANPEFAKLRVLSLSDIDRLVRGAQ